jgi:hypothetical protein
MSSEEMKKNMGGQIMIKEKVIQFYQINIIIIIQDITVVIPMIIILPKMT